VALRARTITLVTLVGVAAALAAGALVLAGRGGAALHCTHGVSSIGPVVFRDGKVVGDTTPRTESCLR
jgi:hypothetical protein